jgi:leader peptidase (prepilin peptidase)/N-methyltransferase
VTLPLILVGLIMAWLADPETLFFNEATAAFCYLVLRLAGAGDRLFRKGEGLGVGDAMLAAAAAAWLGPLLLGDVVLVSALVGLAMAVGARLAGGRIKLDEKVAFGPAVALAFYIVRLRMG